MPDWLRLPIVKYQVVKVSPGDSFAPLCSPSLPFAPFVPLPFTPLLPFSHSPFAPLYSFCHLRVPEAD